LLLQFHRALNLNTAFGLIRGGAGAQRVRP
jgi:hypothetical protein